MEQLPLLQTKLFIPPARSDLVSRPRLSARLNAGLERQLSIISAPAGFGKTTLLSDWAHLVRVGGGAATAPLLGEGAHSVGANGHARPGPPPRVAWLSLDEGDNDPTRFLSYFIAALQRTEPELVSGVLAALQSHQPPPPTAILSALINELTTLPGSIILILDDYHLIEARDIHDALTFLLNHLPPQMHLVIATREDPHLPLARLRARGQLTELRASELRFTSSEAAEFLNQVMELDLSAEDIAALEARTEGWIAGLHLAALSIQDRADRSDLIESFTGSHRFVLDYLFEEVLHKQSEGIQEFLLHTSILDRLTGPLCDAVRFGRAESPNTSRGTAVTNQHGGQATLEMLDRANLFVIPLDQERRWYRYHRLFADLLRQRLRRSQPELLPTLHHRASEWYELNGFPMEAIEHALHANDFERTAQLLEEHLDALWGRGDHSKSRSWLDRLPEEVLFSRPHISIYQARYQCLSGQLDAAERTLQAAEQALGIGRDRTSTPKPRPQISSTISDSVKLRGRAAATRALVCSYQGDVPGILQHARQALEYLPREDLTWRSVTALILGNAHGFKGDMAAAYQARLEALRACEAAGDIYFIMIANLELAITLRAQGQLQRTIEICQQQMQQANENGLAQTKTAGWLLSIWGETLAEQNDLNGALDRGRRGFELTERSGDLQMIGWSFICLIRTLLSRGDLVDAEATIREIECYDQEAHLPPWIARQMRAWQVRVWLAQGKLEQATQWAAEHGLLAQEPESLPPLDFFTLMEYIMLARILIAQGQVDGATELLQPLLEAAEAGDRKTSMIEILGLQALAFQAGGETTRAMAALEQVLTLAEPEGFVRVLVDEGPAMERLLQAAATRSIMPGYTARLLAAFEGTTKDREPGSVVRQMPASAPSPASSRAEALVEPLSERELEVLQLIAEGLTNREIASRLFVSLNTVKAHTRNIYGKLGVHSRTQATARSQELGILSR